MLHLFHRWPLYHRKNRWMANLYRIWAHSRSFTALRWPGNSRNVPARMRKQSIKRVSTNSSISTPHDANPISDSEKTHISYKCPTTTHIPVTLIHSTFLFIPIIIIVICRVREVSSFVRGTSAIRIKTEKNTTECTATTWWMCSSRAYVEWSCTKCRQDWHVGHVSVDKVTTKMWTNAEWIFVLRSGWHAAFWRSRTIVAIRANGGLSPNAYRSYNQFEVKT